IVYALEMLKKNWVRHRGLALVVVEDAVLSADAKLELASSARIVAFGRELRVEHGNDVRVRWTDDAQAASSTHESLLRLKQSAGVGARERPTIQQVEQVIDELLSRIDRPDGAGRGGHSPVRLVRGSGAWEDRAA